MFQANFGDVPTACCRTNEKSQHDASVSATPHLSVKNAFFDIPRNKKAADYGTT